MTGKELRIGITSIQRNRGPWIVEWLAFHMIMGVERFFLYAHKCNDDMIDILLRLSRHYPITVHQINMEVKPQIAAYNHAWTSYSRELDWMAFIDGDEFLFSPESPSLGEALAAYQEAELSALAAYWICYGGNGHVREPDGLVLENYPRHSSHEFLPNRHLKSVVRCSESIAIAGSHIFNTPRGTFDEQLRPIHHGWMKELEPSTEVFRINHYAVQSYDFFKGTKQTMGAADADPNLVRPDSWYEEFDRNECDDGMSQKLLGPLKVKVHELNKVLGRV